jgi:hypothetical protein
MSIASAFRGVRLAIVALGLTAGLAAGDQARADLPSGNFGGSTQITVAVDNDVCRTGAVQCTGAGFVAPAQGNRIPVAVRFQALSSGGAPVGGITSANVSIVTAFVPAGGSSLSIRSCTDCFQALGSAGVYGFYIEPAGALNWKSGTYYIQVKVVKGSFTARALTEIKIPF